MSLAFNTNVKRTRVNLTRFLSPFLLSPPSRKANAEAKPSKWGRRKASVWSAVFWAFSLPAFCQPKGRLHFGDVFQSKVFFTLTPSLLCVLLINFSFPSHHTKETIAECRKTSRGKGLTQKNEPLQKYMLMGRSAFFVPFSLRCATELDWFERLYIFFQIWVNFSRSNCALRSFFCV